MNMNNSIQSSPCPECGGTGRKGFPPQWVPCSACQGTSPLEDKPAATNRWLFLLLAIILIGTFLWRALATAHEFPSTGLRNMTIGLDILCLVGLIGLWIQISRKRPAVGLELHVLFWIALLAGLGLFAIRLNGTKSWWTGHLKYELSPRSDVHVNPVIPAANTVANDTKTGSNTSAPAEPDSPSVVYKAFYAAAINKDIETMKTLISKGLFGTLDFADKKQADERNIQLLSKVLEQPQPLGPSDDTRNEKITGETATVECLNPKGNWYTRKFVKENGKWKITSEKNTGKEVGKEDK